MLVVLVVVVKKDSCISCPSLVVARGTMMMVMTMIG